MLCLVINDVMILSNTSLHARVSNAVHPELALKNHWG